MSCILKGCAHPAASACYTFGQCGARYALEQSKAESGYVVHIKNNPTIRGLKQAGLITIHGETENGKLAIVRAVVSKLEAA